MSVEVDDALVRDVDLLCLDAGNTVIFLDHARLADVLRDATGVAVEPAQLVEAEGEAKRRAEDGTLHDCEWGARARPGGAGWGRMVGTIALSAGLAPEKVPALLDAAWRVHTAKNLWCNVPDGLLDALGDIRALGVKVAIVSNSEGMLEGLFRDLGVDARIDLLVDSGIVGVEKPDPAIFRIALDHFAIPAGRALHLGDVFATDVLGARAAGIRHALIDPYGHYRGRHPEVPRVPGAADVARAIERTRSR